MLDYRREPFEPPRGAVPLACQAEKPATYFNGSTPFRSSDHDPIVALYNATEVCLPVVLSSAGQA